MRYPTHIYAKALAEVILAAKKGEEAAIVKNFIALVRRSGDEVHLQKIVEKAARLVEGKRGVRKVTLGIARPLTNAQKKGVDAFLKPGDVVEERIDPAIIAGIRITIDDELQFDGSLKGKLEKMFTARA